MVLSVKELSSWAQTKGYFAMLGRQLGDTGKLGNLGQGAFTTSNGSVVVRKDWKVLLVDITALPPQSVCPHDQSRHRRQRVGRDPRMLGGTETAPFGPDLKSGA